ncbi:MAG: protein-glutamate O-methyltransferase [Candidatus Hydrogenedentes bacterium]|nr:protein-glutamate O-methyltransferase [Candidatus Hydrogenedentota bacterium]
MNRKTFEKFRSLIYEKSGISLGEQKEALVSARVGKRMRALQIGDFDAYYAYVVRDESGQEMVELLDAISTNVTSFFREPQHFDLLHSLLTTWKNQGQRRFRIWSAASSTGEEPYTIAMTVLESIGNRDVDMRILATDISTRVLAKCQEGVYEPHKLDGVPAALRDRFFDRMQDGKQFQYRANDAMKKLLVFRRLNLATPPFPMRGPLDVVFCRNVMIYFDNDVRTRLLEEIHRLLKPGGYLMVGHAESLTGLVSSFRTVRPSVYTK